MKSHPPQFQTELDKRKLTLALIQAVQMWSNPQYQMFLNCAQPGDLTDPWFSWFVGSWKVARNIKAGRKTSVRQYLDRDFRRTVLNGVNAECVDVAAQYIQRQGWSSRGCLPLSLVSKVGFFLRPDRFVPLDRYSLEGLNLLRTANGLRRIKSNSYAVYLQAFDEQFAALEQQLKAALKEPWAANMANRLGCPRAALNSRAMGRKLFDDYLMHSANYRT